VRLPILHVRRTNLADGRVDIPFVSIKGESRRNHAHDGVGSAIQDDRPPDDFEQRAEFTFPEATAQNRDRRGAHDIVVGSEGPAKNGPYPKGRKKVRGIMPLRLPPPRTSEVVILVAVDIYGNVGVSRCQSRKFWVVDRA
jgi:hypothetical protein